MALRGQLYTGHAIYREWDSGVLGPAYRWGNTINMVTASEAEELQIISKMVHNAGTVLDSSTLPTSKTFTFGTNTLDARLRAWALQSRAPTAFSQAADAVTDELLPVGNFAQVAKYPITSGFAFRGCDITAGSTITGFAAGAKVTRVSDGKVIGYVSSAAAGTAVSLSPASEVPADAEELSDGTNTLTISGAPVANNTELVADTDYKLNLTYGWVEPLLATRIPASEPGDGWLVDYTPQATSGIKLLPGTQVDRQVYIAGDLVNRASGEKVKFVFPQVKLRPDGEADWLGDEFIEFPFTGTIEDPPAGYETSWVEYA